MVRITIECDKPIAINVKNQDSGLVRLLKDLMEGIEDESNDKTFAVNSATAN